MNQPVEHCNELKRLTISMKEGLIASLEGISEEHLNHSFAKHKMTIGQLAVHTMSWPRYFLSENPPWVLTEETCRPCKYPITNTFVNQVIEDGYEAMVEFLKKSDDQILEVDEKGNKGKGYLLYRLQLHIMVHANQIAYLRSILEPDWNFSGGFGNMATAVIATDYHTTKE